MRLLKWGRKSVTLALAGLLIASPVHQGLAGTQENAKPPGASKAIAGTSKSVKSSTSHLEITRPAGKRSSLLRPDVRSNAVLVFDETNAEVLFSRHAEVAAPIASITKLMTALVVLEAGQPLDEVIEITRDDRDDERNSYSRLAIGAKLSRGALLHLALMSSENRAAHAVGRNYPGGLTEFVTAMNVKARALGMTSSRFVDPTGLSSKNVASPADLSKLVIAASENPVIREFSTNKEHAVTVGRQILSFHNTNTLVANPAWDIQVQKTGYISEAGQCLVMKAAIEGRSIVIVLLNSFGKYTRVADAKRIRTWMESRRQLSAARTQ